MSMKKIKAAELILDFALYPRNNLDNVHVRHLTTALEAGAELPPVVIDRKSKRVIDGFHRVRAVLRFSGEDGELVTIEKDYKNEAAMFLDAMKYNAVHGAKLDSADRVHCVIVAEGLRIPLETVAGALHIPAERLGALRQNRTAKSRNLTIPLKRTFHHKAGQKLTQRQLETNERSSGMNQSFYVNQLIDILESNLLERQDKNLMKRLSVLRHLLEKIFSASAA
jgi:hypothetical protein